MPFGLSQRDFEFLQQQLIQPLQQKSAEVFIFGSRARGDHKKFSDIDLLYKSKASHPIDPAQIYSLLQTIDDSTFPYKIDLVNEDELASSYIENVNRDKVRL